MSNVLNADTPVIDRPSTKPSDADPAFKSVLKNMLGEGEKKEPVEPPRYAIVLHNDDTTWFHFVIRVLREAFRLDPKTAEEVMFRVHLTNKRNVVCILPKDEAETRMANAVTMIAAATPGQDFNKHARSCELRFTMELEDSGGAQRP